MFYGPDFPNAIIPDIFDSAVNHKYHENQDSITGKKQGLILRIELTGIKGFENNNDEGQINT